MNEFIPFLQRPDAPLSGGAASPLPQPTAQGELPDHSPTPPQPAGQAHAPASTTTDLRHLEPPRYPARIAVYDDMIAPPRVVVIDPCDITNYLNQITQTVYQLMAEQGGDLPHMVIRELVENFIHASFIEPTISILDKGQTLVFSDQGPGIANKTAAVKPSFSTATSEMKYYIRGVGSGLPMVESYLKTRHGTMKIEDNLGHGTIVTVSFAHAGEDETPATPQAQAQPYQLNPQAPQGAYPTAYGYPTGMQAQQAYAPQGYGAYPPAGAWGAPGLRPAAQGGWGWPQAQQQGWQQPYPAYPQAQQMPGYGQPNPYGYPAGQPMPQAMPQQMAQGVPQPPAGYTTQTGTRPPMGVGMGMPQPMAPGAGMPGAAQPGAAPLDQKLAQVLRAFVGGEHVGGKQLAEELGMSAPTASRRLKDLAEAGLVAKNGQKYELTPQGAQVLALLTTDEDA